MGVKTSILDENPELVDHVLLREYIRKRIWVVDSLPEDVKNQLSSKQNKKDTKKEKSQKKSASAKRSNVEEQRDRRTEAEQELLSALSASLNIRKDNLKTI